MSFCRSRKPVSYFLAAGTLLAVQAALCAQTPARLGAPASGRSPEIQQPAVPPAPFELVIGDAQTVQDVGQRAEIVNLINAAFRHSNVRAQPYDLKTTFTSLGSGAFDGSWQLQDTSPGMGLYRWSAQGPSYSIVNQYVNKILYTNRSEDSIPIRLRTLVELSSSRTRL